MGGTTLQAQAMNPLSGIYVGQELYFLFTLPSGTQQLTRGTVADISYNNAIGTANEFGTILSAEQDIMHFSGTISVTRWARRGQTFKDLGICPVGAAANTTGYMTIAARSNVDPSALLATLLQCLPQSYQVNNQANNYTSETATFTFIDAQ